MHKMSKVLLGIDLGTSAVKAVVLDAGGHTLAEGRAEYALLTPRPGWAEGDPEEWWRQTLAAVQMALRQTSADRVAAIGITGQMHGIVPVDAAGDPVRSALLWPDQRATSVLPRFRSLPLRSRRRLANPLAPGMAGPLLCWLAQEEPASFARLCLALRPKDWLRLRLTGVAATEPSDASATLLYDLLHDRWDRAVIRALGLQPALLASIRPSGTMAGHLTPEAAHALGLPSGLPVAAGAADVAASLLGAGLLSPGPALLSLGSGAQFVVLSEQPQPDPQLSTHLYRAADGLHWYRMAAVQNAGLALNWVRQRFQASWEELYASSQRMPAATDALVFLPCITPERPFHPRPDAAGWLHLRLDHERSHLLYAALEGVAFSLRLALERLPGSEPVDQIIVAGGGSLHSAWRQMLADVLGRPLVALAEQEIAARGAALLAGLAAGIYDGLPALARLRPPAAITTVPGPQRSAYQERYLRYLEQLGVPAKTGESENCAGGFDDSTSL
jgi:xylulokinase